ncbi:MAG: hypothetical protein JXR52_09005 [Bacteroidales bacterium]|nr:hypothetical protein [Bacteroidales bacterium]MBN2698952.1 hypothetical protein [Bacteroidales bacterium]
MQLSRNISLTGTCLCLLLLLTTALRGQEYDHSAGIRAGFSSGLVYKGFFKKNQAVALEALYNRNGLNFSILYQHQVIPFRNKRFQIYFGGGPFSGQWAEQFSLGIAATSGIEYIMRDLPLVFSFDWKPLFNVIKVTGFEIIDFGLSLRYRFEL